MKKIDILKSMIVTLLLCVSVVMHAQVPDAPNPPRLVNDFAGVFSRSQIFELEDTLARFAKRTSNQVTIVTVSDLGGMEASQFAFELGEKWGVGGSKNNNGVVILIKPKTDTRGEAYIATGYGVEGALPDASCRRIVDNEMIPEFKNNDYYAGVVRALNVIMPVLANEYSIEEYEDEFGGTMGIVVLSLALLVVFCFISAFSGKDNDNDRHGNSGTFGGRGPDAGDVAAAVLLGSLLGGSGGSRSSGGSFGGGGFGGFGGFGGGSFGGGGAGGSW